MANEKVMVTGMEMMATAGKYNISEHEDEAFLFSRYGGLESESV